MAGTRGHPTGRKFDAEPSTVRGAHTESPCPTAEGARSQGTTAERQKTGEHKRTRSGARNEFSPHNHTTCCTALTKDGRAQTHAQWGSNKFSPHKSMREMNTQHTTHMTTLWATTPRVMQKPIPRVSATPAGKGSRNPVPGSRNPAPCSNMRAKTQQREQKPCSRE